MSNSGKTKLKISDLSKHLFWDVDETKLTFDENKKLIIKRTLDYGLINDWDLISDYYGLNTIAEIAKDIRDLEKKSASFIATITDTKKEDFLCYTTKRLKNKHWDS